MTKEAASKITAGLVEALAAAKLNLIAEAITTAYAERCAMFDPECWCCKAWAQYDVAQTAVEAILLESVQTRKPRKARNRGESEGQ